MFAWSMPEFVLKGSRVAHEEIPSFVQIWNQHGLFGWITFRRLDMHGWEIRYTWTFEWENGKIIELK